MRFKFRVPQDGQFPNSRDPKVSESWAKKREISDFKALVKCWRAQDMKSSD
jgi:hypothetical protein